MGLQRPCWTIAFVFVWLLLIPGAILTHLALVKLIPQIEDLPSNIIAGFDQTFKFAYLKADSAKVGDAAGKAVEMCSLDPAVACASPAGLGSPDEKDVSATKATILQAFGTSLAVIRRVAGDKYFGVPSLMETAKSLDDIMTKVEETKDSMTCFEIVPSFCSIYKSSGDIAAGMAEVTKSLDEFKNSDIIKQWDERKGLLTFLHALPYFMVIGLLAFSLFWYKGGVCCCCKGGTKAGICLIPFMLFWLVSFILYVVVLAVGIAIRFLANNIEVPVLKGKPTLEEAVDHIETKFSEFWNLVFADLVEGLNLLFISSAFFTAVALVIALYTCCLCCCRPYLKKDENEKADDHTI